MWFRYVTPMAACLCLVTASSGSAQNVQGDSTSSTGGSPAPSSQSLTLTSAFTTADRFDAVVSPRQFDGSGVSGTLGYRATSSRWMFESNLEAARARYRPREGETAIERAYSGRLTTDLTRWLSSGAKRSIGVGIAFAASAEVLEHQYDDPSSTTSGFITGFATLGPSFAWRESIGNGDASVAASVPLVGILHQPYADTRREHGPIQFRSTGPGQLHALDVALRYETTVDSRFGVAVEHRIRGFEYRGGWPIRSLTNATSLGVVWRFGRRTQP